MPTAHEMQFLHWVRVVRANNCVTCDAAKFLAPAAYPRWAYRVPCRGPCASGLRFFAGMPP
jgi:hypothetical protein